MPEPSKIPQAWAADGDYNVIPVTDPGTGLCSWPLGFPTETQTPIAAGGTPPRRQDMNGALNWITKQLLWAQQGGLWLYDATEDYEVGNIVIDNNSLYYCIRANGPASTVISPANDTAGTYWSPLIYSTGKHPDPEHLAPPAVLQVLQAVYPVGSIYTSYNNTSPAVLFGFGTWEKIEGRFLLGTSSNYQLGTTGGAATVALTVAQLPAHNHAGSTASAGTHSHTVSGTAASAGSHSHTADSSSAGAHTHTITINSGGAHTHTASSASAGAHTHTRGTMEITGKASAGEFTAFNDRELSSSGAFGWDKTYTHRGAENSSDTSGTLTFTASKSWTGSTSSNGAHTHTITVNSGGAHTHGASSASAGAHTHTITVNANGAHTHNISGTAANAGAHTHAVTIGNTGSGQAHNNMPPYLAVNMWRRVA